MKKLLLSVSLFALLAFSLFLYGALSHKPPSPLPSPIPEPAPAPQKIAFTFDPLGASVTSTTIPVTINGTTYALTLNSSGTLSLVSATAQGQQFLNNAGNLAFQLINSSTTVTLQSGFNCSNAVCSVDLSSSLATPGIYPFALYMFVSGREGVVTGTINVP